MTKSTLSVKDVQKTIDYIHPDGSVFEICVINRNLLAGWFKDKQKAIAEVQRISKDPELKAVYLTLNPCHEALLSRSNEMIRPVKSRTRDAEILSINFLYVDADPTRPADTNSSDEEHELAIEKIHDIKKDLSEQGLPDPLCGDSGNGGMLLYGIEPQPNTKETTTLIQNCLKALAQKYDDARIKIDQSVHNPARIAKLLGTMTRKGDPAPDRPQRLSKILSIPEKAELVTLEQLQEIASTVQQETKQPTEGKSDPKLDVQAYLNHYGREVIREKNQGDSTLFCLLECVFDPSHAPNEAAIVQADNGALSYKCFHNSCQGRTWKDARKIISGDDKLTQFIVGMSNQKGEDSPSQVFKDLSFLQKGSELIKLDTHVEWVVEQLIPKQSIPLLHGMGGIGKTWVSLILADAVSKGISFFNLPTQKMPVYFVDFENPLPVLIDRVKKIQAQDVFFWHSTNKITPPKMDTKTWEHYKMFPPGLFIFDSLRACQNLDENSSRDMTVIMSRFKELRDLGFTIILLHHTPKNNERQYKGSTAIHDQADHILSLHKVNRSNPEQVMDDDDESSCLYRLGTQSKTRYAPFKLFIEFNKDKGFVIAQEPDTDDLSAIQGLINEKGGFDSQSQAFELIKENIGIKSKDKVVRLLRKGAFKKYWKEEKLPGNRVCYSLLSGCLPILIGRQTGQVDFEPAFEEKTGTGTESSQSLDNSQVSDCPAQSQTVPTVDEINCLDILP